jgi:glycosyltransferase involved in cell wall biosynthesis
MTSVSVAVPCYNYGRYVGEAVRSLLDDQPGVDLRVLIIDDASTDGSAEVVEAIAASDPRVECSLHRTNQGVVSTSRDAIDWAEGDYTILISADDRLTPGSIRRAVDLMEAAPSVGFAYGHPIHYQDGKVPRPARTRVRGWSIWSGRWWLQRRFRDGHSVITSPEVVMRTSVLKRASELAPQLEHANDVLMWMQLAANADVGYIRGVDQAYYRVHPASLSTRRPLLVDLHERKGAYDLAADYCRDRLPEIARLSDLVHRKLAYEALWAAARAYDRGHTDRVPVDGLIQFALDCWPGATSRPLYRTLRLRQRIGPQLMPRLQPLVLSAIPRKALNWWWWQSWAHRGF